jgi:hypothetical protein
MLFFHHVGKTSSIPPPAGGLSAAIVAVARRRKEYHVVAAVEGHELKTPETEHRPGLERLLETAHLELDGKLFVNTQQAPTWRANCRRFETGGVPGPTSEMSPRALAQMGRREAEREGGEERQLETGVREVEIPRPSCSSRAQVGCACSRGYKRPRGRGSERPHASACPVLFPARPTLCKRALVLPFIGVRRGSRCIMGGVAECYMSSGGELAP